LPAGFTLVELLIVILILGIIAMVAWPTRITLLEESRLSGAASDVVTALEFAQLNALSSGRQTQVKIDVGNDKIAVSEFKPHDGIWEENPQISETIVESGSFEIMEHPLNPGSDYTIYLGDQAMFGGVDITAETFGGGDIVTYDAQGAPSDGGTVTLGYGSGQRVVTLDGLTGKVTVSN
jgi:prepilin-type N-terminal cleavage/methylation domain-containing protein